MANKYAIQELRRLEAEVRRVIQNLETADAEGCGELLAEPMGSHREADEAERHERRVERAAHDPVAKSLSDLVTPKQLGMIRALARNCALDPDAECQHVMKCRTEELSKRSASAFIDHLKRAEVEFKNPRRAS